MVLVDTSVWVEYFRKNDVVFKKVNVLAAQKEICCADLIIAELIRGARSEKEIDIIKDLAVVFPLIDAKEDSWIKAGFLSYKLRKKGFTAGLSDCYIAVLSLTSKAKIYTFDKHFRTIQKIAGIELL